MGATFTRPPWRPTVESITPLADLAAIDALLSRLDPAPAHCGVPGCLHLHEQADTREDRPAIAA
jgi:hypothetical protein